MSRDRLRQLWVSLSGVLCVYGTLVGLGVFGSRVEESSGGSLAADATLLAPAVSAFSIWSVIYLGLFAYVIWQWLPGNAADERARAIGWLAGWSMLLNAGWLLVTQRGWIWLSVLVIFALVFVLGVLVRRLTDLRRASSTPVSLLERLVVDGTFGAYVGWVSVASCANIAAAGTASGWTTGSGFDQALAVVVLAVAAGLGVLLARRFDGRLALAAAMAWGLGWIAVARLTDQPHSVAVGVAASVAALVVLGAALLIRRWVSSSATDHQSPNHQSPKTRSRPARALA